MEDVKPDWAFMKRMKAMNPRLGIKFNGTHFVITYLTDRYGEVNIWKVVGEKREFRQPDQREIDMLEGSDIEKVDPKENMNLVDMYMKKYKEDARTHARQEIRDMTKDGKVVLAQAFGKIAGYSKSNSAFRRIQFDKGMLNEG